MEAKRFAKLLYTISDDNEELEKSIAYAYLNMCAIHYSNFPFFEKYFSSINYVVTEKVFELFREKNPINTIDELIEIFEHLVPKVLRKSNGVVYTPANIKKYIVESLIKQDDVPKICDPACGCGSFLITAAEHMHKKYRKSYNELFAKYLFGIDIDPIAIKKTILLFNILACAANETLSNTFENLICADALDKKVINSLYQQVGNGFDCIIGNPPYVRSRNISSSIKSNLVSWDTTRTGNVDLYIPFYEVGIELLKPDGILGYISPNTFIQSVNGRSLRAYIKTKALDATILDFREVQVFKKVTSYTCIVILDKKKKTSLLHYTRLNEEYTLLDYSFTTYSLEDFNNKEPWRLCSEKGDIIIRKIESAGKPLGDYKIRNGLATLKNEIYFFTPIGETKDGYIREYNGKKYTIEKTMCIDVVKPNILKSEEDLLLKAEKAIFPYILKDNRYVVIPENEIIKKYPYTFKFFSNIRSILEKRDKGKGKYPVWYAYGRTQGFNNQGKKILLPYMAEKPIAVISTNEKLLFYCGYAVYSENEQELKILKCFLESSVFWYYILNTSKPYANGYMALAKNYIKTFSIPQLSPDQITKLFSLADNKKSDEFIWDLYNVNNPPINK